MRHKRSARHANVFNFALFIGSLIILIILSGIAIKIFLLFQGSIFDDKSQFVLQIIEPLQTRFLVINPYDKSINSLVLRDTGKNPLISFGIPVDATINSSSDTNSFMLANGLVSEKKSLNTNLNIIDRIKLLIFIYTQDESKNISKNSSVGEDFNSQDNIFSKVFIDKQIYKEGKSITIVNATGISGLGNKIERLLNHMGGNVVSVNTSDTQMPISYIGYTGNLSYSILRFSHILNIPIKHLSTQPISDITVVLGADKASFFGI